LVGEGYEEIEAQGEEELVSLAVIDGLKVNIEVNVGVTETVYVSHPDSDDDTDGEAVDDAVSLYQDDEEGEADEVFDAKELIVYVVDGVLLGTDGSAERVPV